MLPFMATPAAKKSFRLHIARPSYSIKPEKVAAANLMPRWLAKMMPAVQFANRRRRGDVGGDSGSSGGKGRKKREIAISQTNFMELISFRKIVRFNPIIKQKLNALHVTDERILKSVKKILLFSS
jgi:hypothetical protein